MKTWGSEAKPNGKEEACQQEQQLLDALAPQGEREGVEITVEVAGRERG